VAVAVAEGSVQWPDVAAMEVVDPARVLAQRFPAENGPVVKEAGDVLVGTNALAQAEDGTFFVVCTERWKAGAPVGRSLPTFEVRAASGNDMYQVGRVAEVEASGIRAEMAVVVPRDPVGVGKRAVFEMVINPGAPTEARIAVDAKAAGPEVELAAAVEDVYRFCASLDGMTDVWGSDWEKAANGRWTERRVRLGQWTEKEFMGRVLSQIADRRM
jgi:hypothetical protein